MPGWSLPVALRSVPRMGKHTLIFVVVNEGNGTWVLFKQISDNFRATNLGTGLARVAALYF